MPNSPSSFSTYVRPIKTIKASDPYAGDDDEKRIRCCPTICNCLTWCPKKGGQPAPRPSDFNSGKAAIGTGPQAGSVSPKAIASNSPATMPGGVGTPWEKATLRIVTK